MNAQRIATTTAVALLGLLSACGQAPTPRPENFKGKLLGTVTVQFDGNSAKATVTPFKPTSSRQGRDFNVSINFVRKFTGAFDDDGTNSRYAWATFEVANTSTNAISNLNLIGVNFAGKGLGLTPFLSLENLNGQAITNPAIAQSVRPMHGIKVNGTTLEVDPSKADFQAFSDLETQAVEDSAKQAGLLQQLDDVLEYGFVARNNTGGRAIAPSGTGQVTLALRMPKPTNALENPYRFQMTYLLVDEPNIRVTRSIEETTAQVTARAQAVNATEAVLIGADTDTVPGVTNLRLTNARVSSAPQYYIPSQTLAFRIDSPIGVIPANQCTTLTAASSDGGSLGSGVIWSMTGQGALSNQTGTTVTFCAPDVATTASVVITAILRDDSSKSSTLGLSLQAPASVGVAILNVGGSGSVTTGDNSVQLNADSGALNQNASVSLAKFSTPLFAAPEDHETVSGSSVAVQIPRSSLNSLSIDQPIRVSLSNLVLDTTRDSFAEVRIVTADGNELSAVSSWI